MLLLTRICRPPRPPHVSFTMAAASTRVLKCDPESITFSDDKPIYSDPEAEKAITSAVHHLTQGQVVAFPTETVYGLGAIALDATAAAKIFSTKGRPSDNPLIVHISSLSMLSPLLPASYTPPPAYAALMRKFWPGPLTLLFPTDPTRGHLTVAVRMPAHPVARALIAATGAPLAAPSANSSGKPSPTRASHSTVVDGLGDDGALRVLRPGGATVEALAAVLGDPGLGRVLVHRRDFVLDKREEDTPTTPGMKYRHYAPGFFREVDGSGAGRVGLMAQEDSPLLAHARAHGTQRWLTFSLGKRAEPACAAQRLFEGLLSLEEQGVRHIYVEEVAEEREGLAFMNRVKKAAGTSLRIDIYSSSL
ncbi:translation factor [Lactarius psammicola]|nr:translation factor [Lactarius psammicola]